MRVRCVLLVAVLVALADDSFAQVDASAITRTFEVGSGMISTEDTALVQGFVSASGSVVVGAGGTTECAQSAPFPSRVVGPSVPLG
jgi:hypothetical protein